METVHSSEWIRIDLRSGKQVAAWGLTLIGAASNLAALTGIFGGRSVIVAILGWVAFFCAALLIAWSFLDRNPLSFNLGSKSLRFKGKEIPFSEIQEVKVKEYKSSSAGEDLLALDYKTPKKTIIVPLRSNAIESLSKDKLKVVKASLKYTSANDTRKAEETISSLL